MYSRSKKNLWPSNWIPRCVVGTENGLKNLGAVSHRSTALKKIRQIEHVFNKESIKYISQYTQVIISAFTLAFNINKIIGIKEDLGQYVTIQCVSLYSFSLLLHLLYVMISDYAFLAQK